MPHRCSRTLYKALKPGGILGVVEHRGNPAVPQDPKAKSGYVNEDYAIKLIEAQGFRLVAKSEINANPKDTKDYRAGGVDAAAHATASAPRIARSTRPSARATASRCGSSSREIAALGGRGAVYHMSRSRAPTSTVTGVRPPASASPAAEGGAVEGHRRSSSFSTFSVTKRLRPP